MKQVGIAILMVAAIAGLYALPMAPRDACPVEREWQCSGQYASVDDVPETPEIAESDDEVAPLSVGFDELVISRSTTDPDNVWTYELFTSTKWSLVEAERSIDTLMVAVTYESEPTWEGAPRVMRPHPSRLQILDPGPRDVVFDAELPEAITSIDWASDGRLIVTSDGGMVSIYEPTVDSE